MIQLHLDANGNPINAVYNHHQGGEVCDWIHVPRTLSGRPVVYVAAGSHSSYFSPGEHLIDDGAAADTTDGSKVVDPAVIDIGSSGPSWLAWPGRWGASTGANGGEASPTGPEQHAAWNAVTWESSAAACTEGQTFMERKNSAPERAHRSLPARPTTPAVTATLAGHRVTVKYRFKNMLAGDRAPWKIMISMDPIARAEPSLTATVPVRRIGQLTRDVTAIHGKFVVLVRVYARSGGESKLLRIPVSRGA
jgi:hypothetical protein